MQQFRKAEIVQRVIHKCLCMNLVLILIKNIKPMPSMSNIKVKNILKCSLDSIQSPSPSVKIQIMDGKVCFSCKGKTLLGVVNKLLETKSLLTLPNNVLPYYLR